MQAIIRKATSGDAKTVAGLAIKMWKSHTIEDQAVTTLNIRICNGYVEEKWVDDSSNQEGRDIGLCRSYLQKFYDSGSLEAINLEAINLEAQGGISQILPFRPGFFDFSLNVQIEKNIILSSKLWPDSSWFLRAAFKNLCSRCPAVKFVYPAFSTYEYRFKDKWKKDLR